MTLSIMTLHAYAECRHAECRYAECRGAKLECLTLAKNLYAIPRTTQL
jgi:hypothetical protein